MRIGMSEVLIVLLAALILFGPSRLPEMGRSLGKAIREFRRATSDLGRELEEARDEIEQAAKPGAVEEASRGGAGTSDRDGGDGRDGPDEGAGDAQAAPNEDQPR